MSFATSDARDGVVEKARRLIGIDTRLMLRESKENMTVDGTVTGSSGAVYQQPGWASPQPHARTNEFNIPLITILKTLVKRCILVMSRHRFVRNLDLDGNYFPYSLRWVTRAHLIQKSATMALFPTVEMISHQRNMVWLVSFSVLLPLLRSPVPLVFSPTRSRAREHPRHSWFRGAIRVHRFLHHRNPLGLLL